MRVRSPRAARRRRGTAYVLAVGLSLLIAAVATGSLLATRARFAGEADRVALAKVEMLVDAGLAAAMRTLNADASYASGTVVATRAGNFTLGGGTVRWGIAKSVAATGKGLPTVDITVNADVGVASRRFRVTAIPARTPLSAFEQAVAVAGTLGLNAGSALTVSGTDVATAGAFPTVGGTTVLATVDVVGTGSSDAGAALQRSLHRPSMPNAGHIAALRSAGTSLSIPLTGGAIVAGPFLLSPTSNPYGALNRRGIYVLDCAGRTVTLTNVRIVGTLILVNPAPGSSIAGGMLAEAAEPGLPCIVVDGGIFLNVSSTNLSESSVNFNPQGTPYPYAGGSVDSDLVDVRTSRLHAPIVVTGSLAIAGVLRVTGLVVGGDCAIGGHVTIARDDWAAWSPPDELLASRWRIDPTTRVELAIGP